MKFKTNGWRIAAAAVIIAGIAVGIYFLFPYALELLGWGLSIFLPFILGYLFSLLINPLADKLQNRLKLPEGFRPFWL